MEKDIFINNGNEAIIIVDDINEWPPDLEDVGCNYVCPAEGKSDATTN